jgi:hypothetical protein
MKRLGSTLSTLAAALLPLAAQATEGGGSTYPAGVENFLVGAAPPPGFYMLGYGEVFSADTLNDNNGNAIPIPGFKVQANVAVARFVWSTPQQLLGGNLVAHAIVPLVNLKVSAAGVSQDQTGIGDVSFGPAIAFHHTQGLHSVAGFDLVAPVGGYDAADLANIGRNYWSFQPLYALSLIDPQGFNADFKATLNINQRNKDTDFKSGNEFWLDYAAGWGFGNGWTFGVGGYATRQLTDDEQGGATLANNKASGFAIGPSIKYDNGKGRFVTAKLEQDMSSRNRVEGQALWVKGAIPF